MSITRGARKTLEMFSANCNQFLLSEKLLKPFQILERICSIDSILTTPTDSNDPEGK